MSKRNPRLSPDVLDRQNRSVLGFLYLLPGRAYLWFRYILAPKGRVFATARRARSPIVSFVMSTLFWIAVVILFDFLYWEFTLGYLTEY